MPTFTEAGLREVEAGTWFGLAVAAQTPKPVIKRITDALAVVFTKPEFNERLASVGVSRAEMTPEQATAYARREIEKWTKLAHAIKMQPM